MCVLDNLDFEVSSDGVFSYLAALLLMWYPKPKTFFLILLCNKPSGAFMCVSVFVWAHCTQMSVLNKMSPLYLSVKYFGRWKYIGKRVVSEWGKETDHLASFAWQHALTLWPLVLFWRIPFVFLSVGKTGTDTVKTSFLMKCFIFIGFYWEYYSYYMH